jgi:hypothetical protein
MKVEAKILGLILVSFRRDHSEEPSGPAGSGGESGRGVSWESREQARLPVCRPGALAAPAHCPGPAWKRGEPVPSSLRAWILLAAGSPGPTLPGLREAPPPGHRGRGSSG